MRPVRLTISAFCSYSGTVEIDMDKLGKNGIYLITGETGAGKTTIFDAITYALFGEPSGDNRKVSMLRSKYADPKTPTQVTLTFEYDGELYTVTRTAERDRPNGTTKIPASAVLTYPDGRTVSSISDVNSGIVGLIGVDRKRFTQIAMIAQGDFIKLLKASTAERQMIFNKIFNTEIYNKIQTGIKNMCRELEARYTEKSAAVRHYAEQIACSEKSQLFTELQTRMNDGSGADVLTELLCRIIEEQEADDAVMTARLAQHEELIATLNTTVERYNDILKSKKDLDDLNSRIAQKSGESLALKTELKAAEKKLPEADKTEKRIAEISASLPEYDELDKKNRELTEKESIISDGNMTIAELQNKLRAVAEETAALTDELSGLDGADTTLQSLNTKLSSLSDKRGRLTLLQKDAAEYSKVLGELDAERAAYMKYRKRLKECEHEYSEKHTAFLDSQAGILAAGLEDGKPCPVCGSTEHPHPAQTEGTAVTESELKALETKKKVLSADTEDASRKTGVLDGRAKEMRQSVLADLKELVGLETSDEKVIPAAVNASLRDIDAKTAALKADIAAAEKNVQRRTEIEERLPVLQENEKQLRQDTVGIGQDIAAAKAARDEISARITELSGKLGFPSRKAAVRETEALKQTADRIRRDTEQKRRDLDQCNKIIAGYKGSKLVLDQQLANAPDIDISDQMRQLEEAQDSKDALQSEQKKLSAMLIGNRGCLERLTAAGAELEDIRRELSPVKVLSDTANGSLAGREKIPLEAYAQMSYFERMLDRANVRLIRMTNGQYELKRREVHAKNNEKTGLDLDIADNFNGSVRDVASLSGGESFMAALALAFGLSDEIQSRSSIKLDTMFIDEGFGSLHPSALDNAVSVLAEMSGSDRHRLIGIISHVQDLKSCIDKQVIVSKGADPETGVICTKVKINA